MSKLLNEADFEYLDTLIEESKVTMLNLKYESEKNLKKVVIKAIDTNEYSKDWKFPVKYAALKYLKLV